MFHQASRSVLLRNSQVGTQQSGSRFAVVGTYSPRICGIATFTQDLVRALRSASQPASLDVVALNSPEEMLSYPPEVVGEIRQEYRDDYLMVAAMLNRRKLTAISLQHEFGIFGGM